MVRREGAATVHTARPESLRERRVQELVVGEVEGGVELGRMTGLIDLLVQIRARRAVDARCEACRLSRRTAEAAAVTIEAVQPVDGFEKAHAGQQRQFGIDVPGHLTERRTVAVGTHLLGEPDGVRPARHRERVREAVDQVTLLDPVRLTLPEQAGHGMHGQIRGRRHPHLMRLHDVAVFGRDVLRRIDQIAGVVGDVRAVAAADVIEERVVRVVELRVDIALQIGAGVHQIEIADLAFHRERRLIPAIVGILRIEVRDIEGAQLWIFREQPVGLLPLPHHRRSDRPVVVQVDLQRRAATIRIRIVVAALSVRRRGRAAGRRRTRIRDADAGDGKRNRPRDVIDITRIVLGPTDHAHGRVGAERDVDEALAGRAS